MSNPSPIFSKMFDFMRWILPVTIHFPRQQRFVLAQAIQSKTMQLYEELVLASKLEDTLHHLKRADAALTCLRTYLRLCQELAYLSNGQYEHGAKMLVEIGKLLGGWQRSLQ